MTLAANASDAGAVERVEFIVDGALLATATSAPWQVTWDTAAAADGGHTVSARAYDLAGNSAESAIVDVSVDNVTPTVTIDAPAEGAVISGAVPVTLTVDDAGGVGRVDLYANGIWVGSDAEAPWELTWAPGTLTGAVSLTATATDAAGNVGTSAAVSVTVVDVSAPVVSVAAPLAGARLRGTVAFAALASDDVGVVEVEFLVDGVPVATDTVAPWSFAWDTAGTSGPRVLMARATDAAGNTTTSPAVTVQVDNTVPTVGLSGPIAGSTLAGVTTLVAEATDDVAVARVDFYVEGARIGSDSVAPYTAAWDTTHVPDGSYLVSARAFDQAGNEAATAAVSVTVANPIPETATWLASLEVPACGAGSAGCTSGTLLDGRGTVGPEADAPNTIGHSCGDGTSGAYHWDESLDGLTVATLDGTRLAPGKEVRITATAWIYSVTSDRLDLYYAADAYSPAWTYIATVTPQATGPQTLTASYWLPPGGSLQAIRGVLRYGGTSAVVCGGGGYDDNDDLAFAVTVDDVAPTVVLASPGSSGTVSGLATLNAVASDGTGVGVARVDFYSDGTLIGSDSEPPYAIQWNTASIASRDYSLAARAVDLAGNESALSAVTVTVSNSVLAEVAVATYDATLKAPTCSLSAIGCTTGTLVQGRGTVGSEPNQPNTIYSACADGTVGTYQSDESLEELTIETTDQTGLGAGKSVTITARAWVYSQTTDRIDVYHAKDANDPTWTYVATLVPTGNGEVTLSTDWTLPGDGTTRQAIRGVLRYGGVPAPCVPGAYNDHDDLVFATLP